MSEKHQVLFRKYRPQTFSEVIYQDLAVGALQNAFKQKKIGHAYIFFGPRGVGKTSIARILAKRLNCKTPKANEPCNECASCTEITRGISQDVLEIDAASNRGIENIRELRENVKFTPMSGQYRVYIIDEVHMLTEHAFNALLKTLEEPPAHVVFILATTDFHKVPETILSRCQDFIFKKVPLPVLQSHVEKLCKLEGIAYDAEGLFWVAQKGDGSVRDTLSFMEQAVVYTDSNLTGANIRSMIGYHGIDTFANFVRGLIQPGNNAEIFRSIEKMFQEGQDLHKFIWDFLEFLNTIVLASQNLLDRENTSIPLDDIDRIKKDFREYDPQVLNLITEKTFRIYEDISHMRLRNSQEIKIYLEIQFRKLLFELEKPSVSGLIKKLADLSREIQGEIKRLPAQSADINNSGLANVNLSDSGQKNVGSIHPGSLSPGRTDPGSTKGTANPVPTSVTKPASFGTQTPTPESRNQPTVSESVSMGDPMDTMESFVKENFSGTEVDPSTTPDI